MEKDKTDASEGIERAAAPVSGDLTNIVQNAYVGQTGEHLDAAIAQAIAKEVRAAVSVSQAAPVGGEPLSPLADCLNALRTAWHISGVVQARPDIAAAIERAAVAAAKVQPAVPAVGGALVAMTGKTHELKTDPDVFAAVIEGRKTYEIRFNDRGFAVGDVLILRETEFSGADMRNGKQLFYTGRTTTRIVSHILTGYGLTEGWCILSFAAPTGSVAAPEDK